MSVVPYYEVIIEGHCYTDDDEDKYVDIRLKPTVVGNGDGEAGFSYDTLCEAVNKLKLTEHEKSSLWNYFYDNYATTVDEYYYGPVKEFIQYVTIPVSSEVVGEK